MHRKSWFLFLLLALTATSCKYFSKERHIKDFEGTDLLKDNPNVSRFHTPIDYVPFNTKVMVVEKAQDYSLVEFDGKKGWVYAGALDYGLQNPKRYVNSIQFVALRDKPYAEAREAGSLENNDPVEVITTFKEPTGENMFFRNVWSQVKSSKGTGWVSNRVLGSGHITYYFFVSAYSGLNIREAPSTASKIIKVMPFSTSGSILKRERIEAEFEGRKGFWFYGDHDGTKGYVFSGFTLISSDLEAVTKGMQATGEVAFKNFLDEFTDVAKISDGEFMELKQRFPQEEKHDTPYFEVFVLSRPAAEQCEQSATKTIVFRNKNTGVRYTVGSGLEENIVRFGFPFDASITTLTHRCRCCCPWIEQRTYFLMKDEIKALPFQVSSVNGNGSCNYGPLTYYTWGETWTRLSPTEIQGHLRFPNCADEVENAGKLSGPGMGSFVTETFRHELFATIQYDPAVNSLKITKKYDAGIPEGNRAAWETSEPVR